MVGFLHGRVADDGAGVEGHGQALARPLGVPDHANAPVAGGPAGSPAGLVAALGPFGGYLQVRSAEGLVHGGADGVELVVAGHLLDQLAAAVVVEDDEVPHQGEETLGIAGPFQENLKLRHGGISQFLAGDGAPGLEPLLAGGESPDAGGQTVGDD